MIFIINEQRALSNYREGHIESSIKNFNLNEQRMLEILQGLVRINSVNPPGSEKSVAEFIYEFASAYGLECELHHLSENRSNVVVKMKGQDSTRKKIYLNGHLDTVPIGKQPWTVDPFKAEKQGDLVYGRGTSDMKGGVAALLETMIMLKENQIPLKQDLIFIGTAGEEVDCLGAREVVQKQLIENPGAIIIAEPSSLEVFVAHKGVLWIEISTIGRTAHGSMPEEGNNAILLMLQVINKINQLPIETEDDLLGKASCSINMIEGGVATNVVPDHCLIKLDIRTVEEGQNDKIIKQIKKILEQLSCENSVFRAEISILQNLDPLKNELENDFIKSAKQINAKLNNRSNQNLGVNYYTDASVFRKHFDVPIIIYGAGDEKLAHQPDEYVSVKELKKSIMFYAELIQDYQN